MFGKFNHSSNPSSSEWLEQALNNPRWGIPIVKLAIAEKKESRNSRGLEFNCFVLNNPVNALENNEFLNFLNELQNNIETFTDTTRFQVALFSEDKHHWTAFDFLIAGKKLHVFCLDAANDSSADLALDEITSRFTDCNAYRLEPDRDPKETNSKYLRLIQTDRESCSRMTIEHIFLLSKRNFLFDEKLKEFRMVNGVKLVSPDTLFRQAPELYRVTQVRSIFDSLVIASPKEAKKIVSKKGLNILHYTELHGSGDEGETKTSKNETIDYKKSKVREQVERFVVKYGVERIEEIVTGSEQQWGDFFKMPHSKKVEFLLGSIRDKSFTEITNNVLIKNINDRYEHMKYIETKVIKSTGFFKGLDQYFVMKNIKKDIKKLEGAMEVINKLSPDSSPEEVLSSLKKLKLPSPVLKELKTARQVYSQIDLMASGEEEQQNTFQIP
ncbi:hypothetical protein [Legionella maioricensis]|uniref:Dot/Icm T4SS effector n=1 Tax=Legionella maioricensis TaxID=2896528 RepID=A0A9X2IDZ6_9GAMM|nr:hypothetical protein [Legionella maioricensis]MCL9685298.1 hypothetical protein [Legionella maioricensis]MCL9688553.1 hypothetical protein [Legionella maioricensis]